MFWPNHRPIWVPHIVCTTCVRELRMWSKRKNNTFDLLSPVLWLKTVISAIARLQTTIQEQKRTYPTVQSVTLLCIATKTLYHHHRHTWNHWKLNTVTMMSKRYLNLLLNLIQVQVKHVMKPLNLPKDTAELLRSRLAKTDMLAPGNSFLRYCKIEKYCTIFCWRSRSSVLWKHSWFSKNV